MMNGFPPYERWIKKAVEDALTDTPITVIQGARQVGKSTLAQMVAASIPGSLQVTLDDPTALAVAESDPGFFLGQAGDSLLVVDEAQRAPNLILPLKANVDQDRRPGRFILTGSTDLLQVRGTGDSLAGRAETVELKPLSQGELARRPDPEDFVSWLLSGPVLERRFANITPGALVAGGYPEASRRQHQRRSRWFDSYVERLSTHDARELSEGDFADYLLDLLKLLAAGGAQELVNSRFARVLGIAESTVSSYLRLARSMRLMTELRPWGRNYRSRITRRSKVGLLDTGLAANMAGFTEAAATTLGGREYYGNLLELLVATELEKQSAWSQASYAIHHFRDLDGLEVDIIIELADGRLLAIEVKSSSTVTEKAWSNLRRFRTQFADRQVIGVCLYTGTAVARIEGWLHVLPVTALWQH